MIEQIKPHLTADDVFTDLNFNLTVLRRSPQIPFPKHTHDFTELVIVYGGSGIHFTEGEEYIIRSGDVFILTGDRAHGYKDLENLQLINVIFNRSFLQNPAFTGFDLDRISGYHALFTWEPRLRTEHKFESRLRLSPADLVRALSLAGQLEAEIYNTADGHKAIAYACFIQLCGFLSRCYDASSSSQMKELSRLSGALSYMEDNVRRGVTISELTQIAGMSESTLLRLFHRITDCSPIEYHNRLKIDYVCMLLKKSDKTITEIAFDLGFSDSNYLSRLFKKINGDSPREWRRNQNKITITP